LTVQVKDSSGQLIPGVQVNFSGSGLSFTPASAITDANGQATVVARAVKAGNLVATASVTGLSKTATWSLTVSQAPLTVHLLSARRLYGSPNPAFTDTIIGLVNGDTVMVNPSTTATPSSPVGSYPITATITGPAAPNYTLTVVPGTLEVAPAQLLLTATSYTSIYGQTPAQPTAFTLKGFVNGDTLSVVTGAPVLSTTVTATTPAGYYPIQTAVGSLTAPNYIIVPFVQKGVVHVEKALLTAKANNIVIHQYDPIPAFTYTLTGFVNGDTASVVTGTASMKTDARSQTRPGVYPIYTNKGTLYSPNYSFTSVNGTLTILP